MNWMGIHIGQGYDVHALIEGRKLTLSGVEISHTRGLLGHSGADTLLHVITDALSGAVGLSDIGRHFPDTDPILAGADSRMLLRKAVCRVHKADCTIGNVDATVIVQKPKLVSHVPDMVTDFAEDLGIASERYNVKAKTSERLGSKGKGEGIVAQAVVLIYRAERVGQD